MLAILLTALTLAQDPIAAAAFASGGGPRDAMQVCGTVELDPAAAYAAARGAVVEQAQRLWTERAGRQAQLQLPSLVPQLFADQAVRRFLQRADVRQTLQVVDRDDRVREHEFGRSWQTTLWVVEDPRASAACERQLQYELRRTERALLFKSGGTVAFWAVLMLVLGWLDRLSRGYMTGRLRLLGLLLGTGIPAVAFLL